MAFAVVPSPKSGALESTVPAGGLIIERLSRDVVKYADGPVNLLEATQLPVMYQKILTRK